MSVDGNHSDFRDRFDVTVDPNAEPTDVDDAVAEFLLSFVASTTVETPMAERRCQPLGQDELTADRVDDNILNRSDSHG